MSQIDFTKIRLDLKCLSVPAWNPTEVYCVRRLHADNMLAIKYAETFMLNFKLFSNIISF